jgi:hypothetical protein
MRFARNVQLTPIRRNPLTAKPPPEVACAARSACQGPIAKATQRCRWRRSVFQGSEPLERTRRWRCGSSKFSLWG